MTACLFWKHQQDSYRENKNDNDIYQQAENLATDAKGYSDANWPDYYVYETKSCERLCIISRGSNKQPHVKTTLVVREDVLHILPSSNSNMNAYMERSEEVLYNVFTPQQWQHSQLTELMKQGRQLDKMTPIELDWYTQHITMQI